MGKHIDQRNIKLVIAYDGSGYHGFQRQENALAIQQVLEERLAPIFGHKLTLHGAARTDTGVHAYGQVVNFHTNGHIPVERIPVATRGVLPADIVITGAEEVAPSFHARIAAKSKKYLYRIYCQQTANPFCRNFAWHIKGNLNVADMHAASQAIIGTHDFSTFRAAGSTSTNPVRTMYTACVKQTGDYIEFHVRGSGFLYHMVRNFTGTLVEIGQGRKTVQEMAALLAGKDRSLAGATAPPQGLYLQEVSY